MRQFLLVALLLGLLVACGPDRAQTIDPPTAATEEPNETPAPTETATERPIVLPTATERPIVEATSVPATPTVTLPPTDEPTETPQPTATAEPKPTVEATVTSAPAPTIDNANSAAAEIDQAALLASLLALSDMPTGWTGTAPYFESRTPGGTYGSFCAQLPARSIAAAIANFRMSALGPVMSEAIILYPDSADASAAFDDIVSSAQNCRQMTDDEGNTYTFSPLSFPSLGDETFAMRSSGPWELDIINILVDDAIINIRHGGLGTVDSAQTEALARAAMEKYGR